MIGSKEMSAMDVQPVDDLLDGGWFTTEELARMLGVDPSTLRRWRTTRPRQGPPFICLSSRVTLYSARDVRRWLTTRRIDPGQAA
jgi:transposase-like protein